MPIVSEPTTVAEAAEAMRTAGRIGIEKDGGDLLLSTRYLDRILEHEPGDLTLIAEAGVRLSAVNAQIAAHGQILPLDPPGDPTLGACLAGNLSGPLRHRYGTTRDLVIGVTVVLSDGTVASSGGKVVKNVAGYDLGKLFCGSRGTLGLVARVCVRLYPGPAAARTLVADASNPGEAQRLVRLLAASQLTPSAVDVLWPGRIALLFEGGERGLAAQVAEATRLLGARPAGADVWAESRERQGAARGRLSFAPGELAATLAAHPEAVVRAAAGVAYLPESLDLPADPAYAALVARIRAELDPRGALV